ncbi:hypothetical protein ACFV00_25175 [Streptomyces californicus]|uniref:hypothetical protein n=1 Tax=Streptomyces californicus TaxID=67351 RepID=UPI0036BFE0F2
MTRQLTTQNATITTAAVEVKTLTISGKQVTLAVFRQLQEEPLIAQDGTLNGEPWGVVNYHPDKCGDSQFPHTHVVWQRGTELLRARVDKIPSFEPGGRYAVREGGFMVRNGTATFRSAETNRLLTGSVLQWLSGQVECPLRLKTTGGWRPQYEHDDTSTLDTDHGFIVQATASKAAVQAANKRAEADAAQAALEKRKEEEAGSPSPTTDWEWGVSLADLQAQADTALAEARAARDVLVAEVAEWGVTLDDLQEARHQLIDAEAARRERHRSARRTLAALPQLFIAV